MIWPFENDTTGIEKKLAVKKKKFLCRYHYFDFRILVKFYGNPFMQCYNQHERE